MRVKNISNRTSNILHRSSAPCCAEYRTAPGISEIEYIVTIDGVAKKYYLPIVTESEANLHIGEFIGRCNTPDGVFLKRVKLTNIHVLAPLEIIEDVKRTTSSVYNVDCDTYKRQVHMKNDVLTPDGSRTTPCNIGDASEMIVLYDLINRGYHVYWSFTTNGMHDVVVVDVNGDMLYTIQVKTVQNYNAYKQYNKRIGSIRSDILATVMTNGEHIQYFTRNAQGKYDSKFNVRDVTNNPVSDISFPSDRLYIAASIIYQGYCVFFPLTKNAPYEAIIMDNTGRIHKCQQLNSDTIARNCQQG